MKIYLVYFSPGGSTKKMVRNIAKGFEGFEIEEIDMLQKANREKKYHFKKDDLVILGMMTATKLFGVPKEVIGALQGNNTPFVGTVNCGNGYFGKSLIVMRKAMEKQGFKMVAAGGFIGQYSFTSEIATNRPDEKDATIQTQFGKDICKKVHDNHDFTLHSKLKIDWPNEGAFSTFKCAVISAMPGLGFGLPASWNELEFSDACILCGKCVKNCPVEALQINGRVQQNREKCIGCQACVINCPTKAIQPISPALVKSVQNVVQFRSERKEPKIFL